MTFAAFQVADGRPIELLTFQSGALTFLYTNVSQQVQIGSRIFTPISYTGTEPRLSKDSDDAQITIRIPRTATVLGLYSGQYRSNLTTVTIERFHNNDPAQELQVFFKGIVGSVNREGQEGIMLVLPFQAGNFRIPRYNFGSLCSSFLYDSPGCSVSRDDFRYQTTITSITDGVEIGFTGLRARAATLDAAVSGALTSDELDTYWLAGYIATVDGEVREIMEANLGSDPDTVRILQPFRDALATDGCTVYAGCVNDIGICDRKFDNAINFRGWPYIPEINPTQTELPPGSRTSSSGFSGPQP